MKHLLLFPLALLLTVPVFAQRHIDLTANAVWLDSTGGGSLDDLSDPTDINFEPSFGYGASLNAFVGSRVSIELAASAVELDTTVRRRAIGGAAGGFRMMPITGVLQFHLAPNGFIDPYVGAGAAYVMLDSVEDGLSADLSRIDFDNDAGLVVNAGVGIKLGDRLGIVLDGKYVPVESNATLIPSSGSGIAEESKIDVSPIIVSAGLSFRF